MKKKKNGDVAFSARDVEYGYPFKGVEQIGAFNDLCKEMDVEFIPQHPAMAGANIPTGFDANGLKHPIEKLNRIMFEIILWPIETQAKYADAICVEGASDKDWLLTQLGDFNPDTVDMAAANATAIGNLAYIALHGCVPDIQEKCRQALNKFKSYIN